MAKLAPTTPYYSLLEDILEHLFRPEIQYIEAAADIPNLIELRDVFCIASKYYVYLTIGDTKGFIEIDPSDGFDDLVWEESDVTAKATQEEAKAYLATTLSSASN